MSPIPGERNAFASSNETSMDYIYLKNVLLQFLEQRDKSNQKQLIPVLGKLLRFDRYDYGLYPTFLFRCP
jgi:GRIP domain